MAESLEQKKKIEMEKKIDKTTKTVDKRGFTSSYF